VKQPLLRDGKPSLQPQIVYSAERRGLGRVGIWQWSFMDVLVMAMIIAIFDIVLSTDIPDLWDQLGLSATLVDKCADGAEQRSSSCSSNPSGRH